MTNKDIIISWNVNDGTLRPKSHFINVLQTTGISCEAWEFISRKERIEIIDELVQQDFDEKVNPSWGIRSDLCASMI